MKRKNELCDKKWEICRETLQMLTLCNENNAIKKPRDEKVT